MEIARSIAISNRYGLHARTSTRLAQVAKQFQAAIRLKREGDGEEVDAKSTLALLTLGVEKGQVICLRAQGDDAEAAITAVCELIESKFGEE